MANTFTPIVDKIFARGLLALRENAIMPRLINTDWGTETAQQGDTIDVPVPSAVTVGDVTPGPTPPAGGDSAPTTVPITLNRWRKSDMHVTDKQAGEIAMGARQLQLSEHLKALANDVDQFILGLYTGVYGFAGAPGTTPFAGGGTPDLTEAVKVDEVLNNQLAPSEPRSMVLGTAAKANALLVRAIQDASHRRAGEDTLSNAMIGEVLGFMWAMDQNIPSHTNGTLSDGTGHQALVNGSPTVGDKSQEFDATSLTGTVTPGSVFTVAGDTQTYVVTALATASSNAITLAFEPGAKVAWADNAQMTLKGAAGATYVNNLGFHRDAFALATRTLGPADGFMGGNIMRTAVDPVSGLTLTLEVSREHARTKYQWRILYGAKLVRPELAARLAG